METSRPKTYTIEVLADYELRSREQDAKIVWLVGHPEVKRTEAQLTVCPSSARNDLKPSTSDHKPILRTNFLSESFEKRRACSCKSTIMLGGTAAAASEADPRYWLSNYYFCGFSSPAGLHFRLCHAYRSWSMYSHNVRTDSITLCNVSFGIMSGV